MKYDQAEAELIQDLAWREQEMRTLLGHFAETASAIQEAGNRCCVVMAYAHLEGFFEFAMQVYIRAVNESKLTCELAAIPILAASWHKVFARLDDQEGGASLLAAVGIGDDRRLRKHARRREFAQGFRASLSISVAVPEELPSAESNLTPDILRKCLFVVGLDPSRITAADFGALNKLLKYRNGIAHGQEQRVDTTLRDELLQLVGKLQTAFKEMVLEAIGTEAWRAR